MGWDNPGFRGGVQWHSVPALGALSPGSGPLKNPLLAGGVQLEVGGRRPLVLSVPICAPVHSCVGFRPPLGSSTPLSLFIALAFASTFASRLVQVG